MTDEELKLMMQAPEQAQGRSVALANALGKVTPLAAQPIQPLQSTNVPRLRMSEEQMALPRDEMFQRRKAANPRNTGF